MSTKNDRIFRAVAAGDLEAVRTRLVPGFFGLRRAVGVDVRDDRGATPLIVAARAGHMAIVDVLLSSGATSDARDSEGATALIEAAYFGRTAVVERLLAAGADANASASDGDSALISAARGGHEDIARLLVAAGANVNATDGHGNPAVMRAETESMARTLVALGAALDVENAFSITPLQFFEERGGRDLEEGARIARVIRDASPWLRDKATAIFNQAVACFEAGAYGRALMRFDALLERSEYESEALYGRALCGARLGRTIEVPRKFKKRKDAIGVECVARNLLHALEARGALARFMREKEAFVVELDEPERYRFTIGTGLSPSSYFTWLSRVGPDGERIDVRDPSENRSPTPTDREYLALLSDAVNNRFLAPLPAR
jgi:hypothetical protein